MQLMGKLSGTLVNGPGVRDIIWFQGCNLGCLGCFNPESWNFEGGEYYSVEDVLNFISSSGLTISGGEPFLQAEELYSLLSVLNLPGGVVLFSGFDIEEILGDESKRKCLPYIDLLVYGRYDRDKRISSGLRGSSNQGYYFNGSWKISLSDIGEQSIEINNNIVTGFPIINKRLKELGVSFSRI